MDGTTADREAVPQRRSPDLELADKSSVLPWNFVATFSVKHSERYWVFFLLATNASPLDTAPETSGGGGEGARARPFFGRRKSFSR